MIVGDNAAGKSTLLKAIALAVCDESSAAGLLRESDSGLIRHGRTGNNPKGCPRGNARHVDCAVGDLVLGSAEGLCG